MSNNTAIQVNRELVHLVFRHMHVLLIGESIGAIIFTAVLWPEVNHVILFAWLSLNLLFDGLARHAVIFCYHRSKHFSAYDIYKWKQIFIWSTFVSGLIWMLTALFMLSTHSSFVLLIILVTLIGLTGAANVVYIPIKASYIAFVVPVYGAVLALILVKSSFPYNLVAIIFGLYFLLVTNSALSFSNALTNSLRLRYKHGVLINNIIIVKRDLEAANLRLIKEVRIRNQAEHSLKLLATHDNLTGLANRNLLQHELNKLMANAERHKTMIAILFLDLDNFKKINDTYGHEIGDKVLISVAKKLDHIVRKSDILARLGGDEFLIALSDIKNVANVREIVTKLLSAVVTAMDINGNELQITTSIGISLFPKDGNDIKTLLHTADVALYQAKANSRNAYAFYDANNASNIDSRLKE